MSGATFVACDGDADGGEETDGPSARELADATDAAGRDCSFVRAQLRLEELDTIKRLEPSLPIVEGESPLDAVRTALVDLFADPDTVLNEDAYDACLDALKACTSDPFGITSPCNQVFDGVRALGDGCNDGGECAGDAICNSGEDEECGVCEATVGVGESCVERECNNTLLCDDNNICAKPLAVGAACSIENDVCDNGLACRGDDRQAVDGVCVSTAIETFTVGSACTTFCGSGNVFDGLVCVESRCEEIKGVAVGGACDASDRLGAPVARYCIDSFFGDTVCTDGVCALLPVLDEDCLDGPRPCAPELICSDETSQCVGLPALGAPCVQECAEGLVCPFADGGNVCRAPARVGEDCSTVACADNSFCDGDDEAPKCVADADEDTDICEA